MKNAALIMTFACTATGWAQPASPSGSPPTFCYVRKTIPEKGQVILVRPETVAEQVPVTEKININGKIVEVTKFATRNVIREVQFTADLSVGRVITPDGKQLPLDEAMKRLKSNTVVVMSADFNTPSQAYLRALHADTLVIIPPAPKVK